MNCPYPFKLKRENVSAQHYLMNRGLVPCGQCAICREAKIQDWAFRLRWEMKDPKTISTSFLTLTYADEHLEHVNEETGEITDWPTLVPSHVTKFMKNLRRQHEYHYPKQYKRETCPETGEIIREKLDIRYFLIGEYGTKVSRPHYHAIIYNLHPDYLKTDYQHGKMRVNIKLLNIWDKGFIDVGTLTEGSLQYVCQFHALASNRFEDSGRVNEFSRMSRRPALGQWYVDSNQETHLKSGKYFVQSYQFRQRIPRTLKEKIFTHECPLINSVYQELLLQAQSDASELGKEKYFNELTRLAKTNPNKHPEDEYENRLKAKNREIRKRRKSKGKF